MQGLSSVAQLLRIHASPLTWYALAGLGEVSCLHFMLHCTTAVDHCSIQMPNLTLAVMVCRPFAPWEGCCMCWADEDRARILLCDSCDGEYHLYCLDPPLSEAPPGTGSAPLPQCHWEAGRASVRTGLLRHVSSAWLG